jgi:two-component system chemotaxis response regulator CheB
MTSANAARLLIIDDSAVVRQVVTRTFAEEPSVEVVGVARDGKDGLDKIANLNPDVVVLDLEMPVMDGFETLSRIRQTDKALPVIVFSQLTEQSAAATIEALSLGATDFVLKPSSRVAGLVEDQILEQLMPMINGLSLRTKTTPTVSKAAATTDGSVRRASKPLSPVDAVAIGISTGGPNALPEVIAELPVDFRIPIFILQHMPPMFTTMLADRLDRKSSVSVVEATHGELVEGGRVYVAPGGCNMTLQRAGDDARIVIDDSPRSTSLRPSVDAFFVSAAEFYGAGAAAVVMTGMGDDGLHGCRAIDAAGGRIMVQTAATCVASRMPNAVAEAGLADSIEPLGEIGKQIAKWASAGSTR